MTSLAGYAFLSLPHGLAPYHGVEPQPHESPLARGNAGC
jgi:hypothetical protein